MVSIRTLFAGIDPVYYYYHCLSASNIFAPSFEYQGNAFQPCPRVVYFDGNLPTANANRVLKLPDVLIGCVKSTGLKTAKDISQSIATVVQSHLSGVQICALDCVCGKWAPSRIEAELLAALPEFAPVVLSYSARCHFGVPVANANSAFVLLVRQQRGLDMFQLRRELTEKLVDLEANSRRCKLSDVVMIDSTDPFLKYQQHVDRMTMRGQRRSYDTMHVLCCATPLLTRFSCKSVCPQGRSRRTAGLRHVQRQSQVRKLDKCIRAAKAASMLPKDWNLKDNKLPRALDLHKQVHAACLLERLTEAGASGSQVFVVDSNQAQATFSQDLIYENLMPEIKPHSDLLLCHSRGPGFAPCIRRMSASEILEAFGYPKGTINLRFLSLHAQNQALCALMPLGAAELLVRFCERALR